MVQSKNILRTAVIALSGEPQGRCARAPLVRGASSLAKSDARLLFKPDFGEERIRGAGFARKVIFVALADLVADAGVPQLKVVLQLVGVEDTDDGDAVLFQDEVLLVDVRPLRNLAEVHAGFGDGESMDHCFFGFNQG